jgi:hypothetical protein
MFLQRFVSGYGKHASASLFCLWTCCSPQDSAVSPEPLAVTSSRVQKKPRAQIDVVATAHEGTGLLPAADGSGGVARAFAYWRARAAQCSDGMTCDTLALSTSDDSDSDAHVARIMQQMGYAAQIADGASADNARKHVTRSLPSLDQHHDVPLVIERQGVKLEIIGLTKETKEVARSNTDLLSTVRGKVLAIREHGADVGILLSDVCVEELAEMLRRDARDWAFLVLAIGRQCDAKHWETPIHSTALLATGDGFQRYARARLTFDRNTGALLRADTATVEVAAGAGAPEPDKALAAHLASFSARL